MKERLLLCTITIYNNIYQQSNDVAMGSPLGLVIAGIFMVQLERTLRLIEYMTPWKRYVDNTIATIKLTSIDHVWMILNTFHKNIKFTYELEINKKISCLDISLIRKNDILETTIYRKSTNNGVYLQWDFFAPKNWKWSTLRSILTRAYKICSTKELLHEELKCTERGFIEINGHPKWVVNQLKKECKLVNDKYNQNIETKNDNNTITTTTYMLVLPYKGKKGEKLINSLNKHVKKVLCENHPSQHACRSKKLGSFFNIKDQTKLKHNNALTYLVKCPEKTLRKLPWRNSKKD